ncbi:MAG: NADH-quinone oxidoreductase subunit G [Acidobacteria bacterium]|nr:MAG: NADH-quinone oxidoreductase subunit G [Acidobacteriota bacterium]
MPTFRIDDREITCPDGWTVLQAALAEGIEIPHYCYHPGLPIAGNCRICLVEVEKFPKPAIACNTVATEGMVVHTRSDKVREWREAVMEFLLINHPLDCPICDQAGECKLQEFSYRYGAPTTRFKEEKEHGPKARQLGPHVVFDWERCIKCTRCIRFCEEVSGTGELGMFLRGVREEIGTFPGRPLDNPYSGNVVDLCPVGALTLREFRFRSRVWFLQNVPSVCPGCARGCSIDIGEFRNQVYRITPRENHAVNRWWICDTGRLWGERLSAARGARLDGPRAPGDGGDDPWATALAEAARRLGEASRTGRVAVLASPRASVEETWLLARLAKGVLGGAPVHLARHEHGEDDDLLIRADRAPNARGAQAVLEAVCGTPRSVEDLERSLAAGEIDVLFALGPGLVGPVDDEPPVVAPEAVSRAADVIVVDAFASPLSAAATILLPAAAWGETSGTYVNFAGRVQWAERALVPPVDCRPVSMLLGDLLAHLSLEPSPPSPEAVTERVAAEVPGFENIRWQDLLASDGQNMAGVRAEEHACRATGALVRMLEAERRASPASAGD